MREPAIRWRERWKHPGWPLFALAGTILLATLLRLWNLDLLPPGLYFDEAFNGVDARRVLSGESRPLYFTGNNGREPLFIYLQALSVALLGPTPFALRVVSALAGILTIPAIYLAARELFSATKEGESRIARARHPSLLALVAASGLAVSYWHLSLSRLGFRAILLPLASTLAILFFWRAWRDGRLSEFALAGLCFGLSLYTYVAARILPLAPLLFFLTEALIDARHYRGNWPGMARRWRPRLMGLLVMATVGALVLSPLGVTLVHDPRAIMGRTGDVSIFTASPLDEPGTPRERFARNIVATARAFYDQGDINGRHNLPGRPVNDPLLALLFTAGWLAALLRFRRPAERLILIWFAVMSLPTLLSTQAPHALRASGLIPPLVLLYATGAGAIATLGRTVWAERMIAGGIFAGILLLSGVWSARDYFVDWARLPSLGVEFEVERQRAAEAVRDWATHPEGPPLLLTDHLYQTPQMAFAVKHLSRQDLPPGAALSPGLLSNISFLLEESGRRNPYQSTYLLSWQEGQAVAMWLQPISVEMWNEWLQHAEETGALRPLESPIQRPEWESLLAAPVPPGTELHARAIRYPLDIAFENGLHLVGYELVPDMLPAPGDNAALLLTLFWRADEESAPLPDEEVYAFVHLVGGAEVVQENAPVMNGFPTLPMWRGGDTLEEDRVVSVPLDQLPFRGFFRVGLYHPVGNEEAGERIGIVDASGRIGANDVEIAPIMVGGTAPQADLSDLQPVEATFGSRVSLEGWQIEARPEESRDLEITLGWKAVERVLTPYSTFVHLLDPNGEIVAQNDHPPGTEAHPTTMWVPGETVRDTFALPVPDGDDLAGYTLRVGLYEPVSGVRPPVTLERGGEDISAGEDFVLLPLSETLSQANGSR